MLKPEIESKTLSLSNQEQSHKRRHSEKKNGRLNKHGEGKQQGELSQLWCFSCESSKRCADDEAGYYKTTILTIFCLLINLSCLFANIYAIKKFSRKNVQ